MADVLIIGCGLIGTSIGLALQQAERQVLLHDEDAERVALAATRGAGEAWNGADSAALVVAAVPPAQTGAVLAEAQRLGLGQTYTHVSSVQSVVQADVESLNCDLSLIVGGHPLAGREHSGPLAADAAMFVGRSWAVCPSTQSSAESVAAVQELARSCGAEPVDVGIEAHDRSVAQLSHVPHIASSALAGLLVAATTAGARTTSGDPEGIRFELSGPGLADSTRLAAGDPALWTEILSANARHVAPSVRALAAALESLAGDLEVLAGRPPGQGIPRDAAGDPLPVAPDAQAARAALVTFLMRGRQGRQAVPVKRGRAAGDFAALGVDVDDQPGRLAALLMAAGDAGINVEDVRVDHVPGRPRGLIELLVRADALGDLSTALRAGGWRVRSAADG